MYFGFQVQEGGNKFKEREGGERKEGEGGWI